MNLLEQMRWPDNAQTAGMAMAIVAVRKAVWAVQVPNLNM